MRRRIDYSHRLFLLYLGERELVCVYLHERKLPRVYLFGTVGVRLEHVDNLHQLSGYVLHRRFVTAERYRQPAVLASVRNAQRESLNVQPHEAHDVDHTEEGAGFVIDEDGEDLRRPQNIAISFVVPYTVSLIPFPGGRNGNTSSS